MEAIEALLTRRSTRNYKPDPVEQEKLDTIIEAARQAPSGSNNQSNHFIVISSREKLNELITLTREVLSGMDPDEVSYPALKNAINLSKKGGYVFCYNAPVLIIVANKKDYGNNMADCACALENIMVAANALDLGSCWINQPRWLNEAPAVVEYMRSLGMKEDERVYGSAIIGYPASGLPNRKLMQQKGNEVTYIR
ncbi:MAG: nitroreductase family protein [Oscillospiraceae bacterium]|nr:nitroreductase family protein [Oscillospiraceae bacterium]